VLIGELKTGNHLIVKFNKPTIPLQVGWQEDEATLKQCYLSEKDAQ